MTVRGLSLLLFVPVMGWAAADKIDIDLEGQPFTTFEYGGGEAGKGHIWPVRSPSGKIVTRHFPMEKVEGESQDHLHHWGLWFAYDDVNGIKFWENHPSYKAPNKGVIVVQSAELKPGAGSKAIHAVMNWNGPDGKTILREDRVMTFISKPALRIVDFDITLTAPEKVVFGDTKEGAFAIRLADALTEKRSGSMVAPKAPEGMKNVWGKRSIGWIASELEGEQLGIAIFDHPSNPRHIPPIGTLGTTDCSRSTRSANTPSMRACRRGNNGGGRRLAALPLAGADSLRETQPARIAGTVQTILSSQVFTVCSAILERFGPIRTLGK